MATILYVLQVKLPDEVRAEKICRSLVKAGHTVIVLSRWFPGMSERAKYQGYTVVRAGHNQPFARFTPAPFNPFWRNAIREVAAEFSPDCIIVREMILADSAAAIARRRDIPLLIDMAEHYPAAIRGWHKYQRHFWGRVLTNTLPIPDIIEKQCVQNADGIIVVCEEQVLRLNMQYGAPEQQIAVVHNTPEIDGSDLLNTSLPLPVIFAHHGYCEAERNLEVFIEGFSLAQQYNPQIQLWISGAGLLYDSLQDYSTVINARNIHFTGEYKLAELPALISQCSIGILPYKTTEFINHTISNKLFDYMAYGRPVFVSQAHPLSRIIMETQAGLSWDCTTAGSVCKGISNLLDDNLEEMAENGRNWARKKYNWQYDESNLLSFIHLYC